MQEELSQRLCLFDVAGHGDFGKLPLELREAILVDIAKVDLSALSCTSKWMRDVIEPNLYRDTVWDWGYPDLNPPPVHLLVRTLLIRPTLSTYVKSVDFTGDKHYFSYHRNPINVPFGPTRSVWTVENVPDFSKQEMRLAINLILSLGLPAVEEWLRQLKRGDVDVFVALLLAQSYNWRRLRLNFAHVPEMFCLSSIQNIRMAPPAYSIPWTEQNSPMALKLTSLVLHHTQLSEINLGYLLRASPKLKSLEFHPWYDLDSNYRQRGGHQIYLDCVNLNTSLAFVRASLEHLVINIGFGPHRRVLAPFEGIIGKFDGLQHFEKLSSLEIPATILLGWDLDQWTPEIRRTLADVMPPNLSHLCFTDHLTHPWKDDYLPSLIEEYLKPRFTSQPCMDTMSLKLHLPGTPWSADALTRLHCLCKQANVLCCILFQEIGGSYYRRLTDLES